MIKTILIHLRGDGGDRDLLDLGLAAARPFGAHLECLHVRRNRGAVFWRSSPYEILAAGVSGDVLSPLEEADKAWEQRAFEDFQTFCSREALAQADAPSGSGEVTAAWRESVGGLDQLLQRARFNDLVIERASPAGPDLPPEPVGKLILACGRPVLLTARDPAPDLLQTVAVAWKNTLPAARALSAASPLLSKAGRILLLSAVDGRDEGDQALDGLDDALGLLRWHGLSAEGLSVALSGRTHAGAVMEAAIQQGAGLLVVGGYSHNRALELVLGGFTQDILDDCRLPVFMLH